MSAKKITVCILAAAVLAGCGYNNREYSESDISQSVNDLPQSSKNEAPGSESEAVESVNSTVSDSENSLFPEAEENKNSQPEYLEYFKDLKVHTIELNMPDWSRFINNPFAKTYAPADVKIDGELFENSAIRTRGNSSLYAYAVIDDKIRPPFKIKFDKYVDGRTFHGLDELILLNAADDRSFIRDYIGYEAFRVLGGAAPYVSFFNIYANGELHGLYVGVEAVDKSFLKREFNSSKHNLYKAGSQSTLLPSMALSRLEQKKGSDESKSDLGYLIKVLDEMPLGEKGEIESILNVDSVLKYFAVSAVLYNWDDYSGAYSHNYYLYMDGGTFYFIPWDMNMCCEQWGAHYVYSSGSRTDIATPVTGDVSESERPLVHKLLSIEEYYARYLGYCSELNEWLKEIDNSDYLDNIWDMLKTSVAEDPTKFYEYQRVEAEYNRRFNNGLAYFIHDRTVYLTKRLEELMPQ